MKHASLQIPLELSKYVIANELERPFAIYLFMKMYSDGKIKKDSPVMVELQNVLRVKNRRTTTKHFAKLIELNWIGYNDKSKIYFVRSFHHLRFIHDFKSRKSTTFFAKDLKQIQAFLAGSIIADNVRNQEYYWEKVKRRKPRTATKKDVAKQFKASSKTSPNFYGLSIREIAKKLNCKTTRAVQLKHAAEAAGFIKTKARYKEYARFAEADYLMKKVLADCNPSLAKRLRFTVTSGLDGKKIIIARIQLHDEILPLVRFKKISKFNNLRLGKEVKFGHSTRKSAA